MRGSDREGNLVSGPALPRPNIQEGRSAHRSLQSIQCCVLHKASPRLTRPSPSSPSSFHLFGCREDDALDRGRPLRPQGGVGCGRIQETLRAAARSFPPLPNSPAAPHTKHRDVHVDVGHGALPQLAEELLRVGGVPSARRCPPQKSPRPPTRRGPLTSVNSVEPMSPNSSAPQLANTTDLRGRQVPGENKGLEGWIPPDLGMA